VKAFNEEQSSRDGRVRASNWRRQTEGTKDDYFNSYYLKGLYIDLSRSHIGRDGRNVLIRGAMQVLAISIIRREICLKVYSHKTDNIFCTICTAAEIC
jgi:hypothetical protein